MMKTLEQVKKENKIGDVFTLLEFVEYVEDGAINEHDGHGYLHDGEKELDKSCFSIFDLYLSEVVGIKLNEKYPYVIWCNK